MVWAIITRQLFQKGEKPGSFGKKHADFKRLLRVLTLSSQERRP